MGKRMPRKIKKAARNISVTFIPDDVRKVTFDNGVTMKFIPWYDPTTGKTY